MNEQNLARETMPEQQNAIHPEVQLQNDMTVKDFLALLRENGLDKEVQALNDLFDNMNQAQQQFDAMHQKIQTLQDELDRLRGDTPLTDQFRTEMSTRADHMREHVNDLSDRFVTAKDSIVESARQGIRNFVEKGKVALHNACVSMYQAGIRWFEASKEVDQLFLDYNKNLLERADKAREAKKDAQHERSNLVRAVFGLKPKQEPRASVNLALGTIQQIAENNIKFLNWNIRDTSKLLAKLESHRDHHLEAVKRKPSFDEKLDEAKKRAEFGNRNDIPKDRGFSGPTR